MKDLTIDRADVYTVGPDTERYTWAHDMPEQFMPNAILRLRTRGGLEGVAGAVMITSHQFDLSVAETLKYLLPEVIGRSPLEREALWHQLKTLNTPQVPQALSLIDIALWDLAAKHAGLPLYQFLGGARSKIRSYASTPLLESRDHYVEFVGKLREEGFRAVKYHCWCDPDRDIPMVAAVHEVHGGQIDFMLDVEQRYTRAQAFRAIRQLEPYDLTWFEAPFPDVDLDGYRQLREKSTIPIIPGGNSILDLNVIAEAIKLGCWSAVRVDATIAGGITPTRKIMSLAEANGMTCELQCWGYTLTQAANLHLMLAYRNCDFFEQPTPYPAFEYGALDVIRTDREGYVHAPSGPGLGIGIDWTAVERATLMTYAVGPS
ncbi:mandelate racemase/muconate lactonizing enzyme family protein [Rhodoligotrophos ferricapiens]|uniref:mandelate racemase/muconate lactonizing enzyme family protein n=1 Tax=Rhodoligotrophos ferricapiens TaxID=3069264 RepID=UPI00315D9E07